MIQYMALAAAIVVVLVAGIVALQPAEFRVARTATIAAPASAVFAQVNDFRNWEAWSPWARRDPAMRKTFEGAPAGVGAVYTWAGNGEVGEGRSTIVASRPDDLIRIRLEFVRPFETTSVAEFTFAPRGTDTAVTWSLTGTKSFVAKAMGLVMSMDRMVGGDFETGLAQLKSVVEAAPRHGAAAVAGDRS